MPEPTDHRAEAERWLTDAEAVKHGTVDNVLDAITAGLDTIGSALIGIGHALLAEPARDSDDDWHAAGGFPPTLAVCQYVHTREDGSQIKCPLPLGHQGAHYR